MAGEGKGHNDLGHFSPDVVPRASECTLDCVPLSLPYLPSVLKPLPNLLIPPPDDVLAFPWAHYSGKSRLSGPSSVEENVVKCER